jgi:predicted amidohydrolase
MTRGKLVIGLAQRTPLPVGASLEPFREDVAATLREHPEIEMLVYPEMHQHDAGHLPESERAAALEAAAVPLDDPFVAALGEIAAAHGVWLVPGSIGERADNGYFNTELLFDPQGVLRARYRKMFPWRPFEPHRPGTEFVVAELGGGEHGHGAVGLSNCYDAWFPEHTRQLAWLGADLVVNVVKTTSQDREQELVLARANAIVNQLYVLSVNCAAPAGRGRSIAVDPEGWVLGEAGLGEDTLIVHYEPERVARVRRTGTSGTNRLWEQFSPDDEPIPLPMYGGRIDPARWAPGSPPTS